MSTPISFSKRTTASIAVFTCLFIASPMQGAGQFTPNGVILSALGVEYAQLHALYHRLRHQDVQNQAIKLDAIIAQAITTVENLIATLALITASGDHGFVLADMKTVVANALVTLNAAQSDE